MRRAGCLPPFAPLGGPEQCGGSGQVAQDGGAPAAEVLLGHVRVLVPDAGDVVGVAGRVAGEHREVGVAQHGAVAVAVVGPCVAVSRTRRATSAHGRRVDPAVREPPLGQLRARLLVRTGACGRGVDGVVEPGGQPYGVGVRGLGGQLVDVVEDLGEVAQVVVAAAGLGVRQEQLLDQRIHCRRRRTRAQQQRAAALGQRRSWRLSRRRAGGRGGHVSGMPPVTMSSASTIRYA